MASNIREGMCALLEEGTVGSVMVFLEEWTVGV